MFRAIPLYFIFLRTLLRFFASPQNATPFVSDSSALFAKNHPGWGYLQRSTSKRSNAQTFKRSNVQTFKHVPPVPLQRKAFGATICKGTGFLRDPGKQLRSPRCLRLRERTSGTVRVWSPMQVVPGSSVLIRVSGFVLTNPELAGFRVCTCKP